MRHLRLYRELFVAASVSVHSAVVANGPHAGRIVHLLRSGGTLHATAMDLPDILTGPGAAYWSELGIEPALPRSLSTDPHTLLPVRAVNDAVTWVGVVRPSDLDHTSALMMPETFAYCSSSFSPLDRIGFSPEFVKRTGHSRMAVEVKVTRHSSGRAVDAMQVRSHVAEVNGEAFTLRHKHETASGRPLSSIEQFMVVTDLKTRRGVAIPEALRDALLAERWSLENA